MISRLFCLLILWPLLIRTFGGNTPARPHPQPRPIARQWIAVKLLGRRVVAVRVQAVLL
jgi:hypothetical protein